MRFSCSWAALAAASLASTAFATINNADDEARLTAAAVTLVEGDYTFTNVQTGQSLQYIHEGRQLFPDAGPADALSMTINPSGPYMRIAAGSPQKCLSAQWGYDEAGKGIGADHAGVLYGCAVGDGADPSSTVEKTKQWWLFVPVGQNATTNNLSTDTFLQTNATSNSTESSCQKTQRWIRRHPQYVQSADFNHPECASYLRADQAAALGLTTDGAASADLQRRQNSGGDTNLNGGTFYIVTLDHLHDMATRYLTGVAKTIEGDKATDLELFDGSNALQQWVVTAAS